jgi:hypothetical protein
VALLPRTTRSHAPRELTADLRCCDGVGGLMVFASQAATVEVTVFPGAIVLGAEGVSRWWGCPWETRTGVARSAQSQSP